jgi:hypothetical protein
MTTIIITVTSAALITTIGRIYIDRVEAVVALSGKSSQPPT